MRLISWNIQMGVGERRDLQLAALRQRQPDIVALQEIQPGSAAIYRASLAEMGLVYAAGSFELMDGKLPLDGSRKYGVLLASRWPFKKLPECLLNSPWPERILTATIASPSGNFEVVTTHIPVGGHGQIKIDTLDTIYNHLAGGRGKRLLCGDLNTPRKEYHDGLVMTFGQELGAQGRLLTDEEWDTGERRVLLGLGRYGMEDIFRRLNGYAVEEFSWYHQASQRGFRPDHIIASTDLNFRECRYLHEWRESGLSDHSAIEATFEP